MYLGNSSTDDLFPFMDLCLGPMSPIIFSPAAQGSVHLTHDLTPLCGFCHDWNKNVCCGCAGEENPCTEEEEAHMRTLEGTLVRTDLC